MSAWKRKDLIGIRELDKSEIELIHDTAKVFMEVLDRPVKKIPTLRGKTVINLFVEPSTRTRTSFEMAGKWMSAEVITVSGDASSFKKGESLKDTGMNLQAMKTDFIVLRHPASGAAKFLADRLDAHIINAGDGAHEHPTQALLDTYTLRQKFGKLEGLKVAICGDVRFSRVARSNLWALQKLGAQVTLVGPSTLLPKEFAEAGIKTAHFIEDVLKDSDVLMMLRMQLERQHKAYVPSLDEYITYFGLTIDRFRRCKPDVVIMHPGPINRGIEIAGDLAEHANSIILDQVTSGMAIRMAVYYLLMGGSEPEGALA